MNRLTVSPDDPGDLDDVVLRLVFTCCHPALSIDARVALTLRSVCGLELTEIAHAFMLSDTTLAQRLVRARRKIRDARIPYEVPSAEILADRLAGVLGVIYLVFNEGYVATEGPTLIRPDLCQEGIRLARLLATLMPQEPEVCVAARAAPAHRRAPGRPNRRGRRTSASPRSGSDSLGPAPDSGRSRRARPSRTSPSGRSVLPPGRDRRRARGR